MRQRTGLGRVGTVRGSTQSRTPVIAFEGIWTDRPNKVTYRPLHAAASSVLLYGLQAIVMADGNH